MKVLHEKEFLDLISRNSKFKLITENRKELGFKTYGIDNHAEFVNYHNPHDNCLWDAVIPGYKEHLPFNKKYISKKIIGVLWLSNGNHKIFVRLNTLNYGFNKNLIDKQIKNFIKNYLKINKGLGHKFISKL